MTADQTSKADTGQRLLKRPQGFVDEVFQIIRADIMSLRIPPASRISIDSLARELGVSQTPIREALSMLEGVGLVTKERYVGYCAAPQLNRAEFDELYEARLLMEPFAARHAAERMGVAELKALRELASSMEPGRSHNSYQRFADQDSRLHDMIAQGSGNHIIQDSLARLHTHLHIFRLRFHDDVTTGAHAEHAALVAALEQRDGAAAEAAMRAHIENSYERLAAFAQS